MQPKDRSRKRRADPQYPHPLALRAKRRLKGPDALSTKGEFRRLVTIMPGTYDSLTTTARILTKQLGFVVWPAQVAALILERETRS